MANSLSPQNENMKLRDFFPRQRSDRPPSWINERLVPMPSVLVCPIRTQVPHWMRGGGGGEGRSGAKPWVIALILCSTLEFNDCFKRWLSLVHPCKRSYLFRFLIDCLNSRGLRNKRVIHIIHPLLESICTYSRVAIMFLCAVIGDWNNSQPIRGQETSR